MCPYRDFGGTATREKNEVAIVLAWRDYLAFSGGFMYFVNIEFN